MSLLKTMKSTNPPSVSPELSTSSCRWKRGRPVSSRFASTNSINSTPGMRSHHPLLQSIQANQSAVTEGHGQVRHTSNAGGMEPSDIGDKQVSISDELEQMELKSLPPTLRF